MLADRAIGPTLVEASGYWRGIEERGSVVLGEQPRGRGVAQCLGVASG